MSKQQNNTLIGRKCIIDFACRWKGYSPSTFRTLAKRDVRFILELLEACQAPPQTPPPHVLARLRAKVRQVFGKGEA